MKTASLTGVTAARLMVFAIIAFSASEAFGAGQKMVAVLTGSFGDKSVQDSAKSGFDRIKKELGINIHAIEGISSDAPAWERNLTQVSSTGSFDLIITGSTQMFSTLKKVAAQFPDQKYLIFDSTSVGPNVTGISFAQNEGAFLAGALAAFATKNPGQYPRAKGSKKVGVVGGRDIPVIRDFIVGFQQGAKTVDPDIVVDVRFADDFGNAQKGYDIAMAMYKDGADVIYQVAGPTGVGVLKAGQDAGRYSIGTDSDQSYLQPQSVLGCALKNVGTTIFNAVSAFTKGQLKPGTTILGNIKNGGVGIAFNKPLVTADVVTKIEDMRRKIAAGEIVVHTALTK